MTFQLGDYPAGVAWSVFLCNLDAQAHVWQTRWELVNVSGAASTSTPTPLPVESILAAGQAAQGT